ncbi:MAG: metal-dependent hydrolase [Gammaproteobacteria bacterium]|nr:metal-dependent hydrolase [Gammaproteobacteria bacterium]
MDSLTQLVLGAAVGESVMGRKIGNRAVLWGAVAGTLPDLDVFIPLGDVVKDFTYHRSASHSLFVLALLTPLMVWLINKIHPGLRRHRSRWMLMIYLVFVTHVLLDCFTAYGTQIFWPFVTTPVSWSTIFIIDPLYTLPLMVGVLAALIMTRDTERGHLLNRYCLAVSTVYLCWTVIAKVIVERNIEAELQAQNISHEKIFTTPSPFNSLLWRTVVTDDTGYYEGFYSVLDRPARISFQHYPSDKKLLTGIEDYWPVRRLKWFSRGFYSVSLLEKYIVISDLRMGLEPDYVFRFKVAEISNPHARPVVPLTVPNSRDMGRLKLIWQRIWDQTVAL